MISPCSWLKKVFMNILAYLIAEFFGKTTTLFVPMNMAEKSFYIYSATGSAEGVVSSKIREEIPIKNSLSKFKRLIF